MFVKRRNIEDLFNKISFNHIQARQNRFKSIVETRNNSRLFKLIVRLTDELKRKSTRSKDK